MLILRPFFRAPFKKVQIFLSQDITIKMGQDATKINLTNLFTTFPCYFPLSLNFDAAKAASIFILLYFIN